MPEEFQSLTPQLVVDGAARAIEFYQTAFGANELMRNAAPDGEKIMHAELLLNGSRVMLHDEFPESGVMGPLKLGGSPITLHLYVDDVDTTFQRALDAGAVELMPVQDAFWGERYGILTDPFGHRWSLATPNDALPPSEVNKRAREWADEQAGRS